MSKIKAVLLDFDGTLANTTDIIVQTMYATIRELNLPERTYEECIATIGLKLPAVQKALFPDIDIEADAYEKTYRRLFNIYNADGAVKVYPNVLETLEELKRRGMLLTIASSRSHRTLDDFVRNLGLSDTITYVIGGEDVTKGKPDPQAVNMTLAQFNISADEAIAAVREIQVLLNERNRVCKANK